MIVKRGAAILQTALHKLFQFLLLAQHTSEQLQLVACTHQVVLRIFNLIISVTIYIVGEESHTLHVGEERHGIGQMRYLHRCKERLGRLDIPLCECLEDILAEPHLFQFRRILCHEIGTRTEEVAIVREHKAGHHRIEVDDTQHLAILVKHHVVHFRITVADTFGQDAFTSHALSLTHLVGMRFQFVYDVLHLSQPSCRILGNSFT